MSMTDPIADLLTRIRNAQMASHEEVVVPYSRMKHAIVRILETEGFISGHAETEREGHKAIAIRLRYVQRVPAIQKMRRISKPGRRVYVPADDIPRVLDGLGINIISTSKGVMTGKKARLEGVGGEVLCDIY